MEDAPRSTARTNDPNSATSQFFVNVADNANLNSGDGYAVFARVIEGWMWWMRS